MKTISECASNGLIIVANVDDEGKPTGKYLVFSASGAWTQGFFNSPAEAIAAIEKAQSEFWEVLNRHAFETLVIVMKPDHNEKLENEFFVFTDTGHYKAGPSSLDEAYQWVREQVSKNRLGSKKRPS